MVVQCVEGQEDLLLKLLKKNFTVQKRRSQASTGNKLVSRCAKFLSGERCVHTGKPCKQGDLGFSDEDYNELISGARVGSLETGNVTNYDNSSDVSSNSSSSEVTISSSDDDSNNSKKKYDNNKKNKKKNDTSIDSLIKDRTSSNSYINGSSGSNRGVGGEHENNSSNSHIIGSPSSNSDDGGDYEKLSDTHNNDVEPKKKRKNRKKKTNTRRKPKA